MAVYAWLFIDAYVCVCFCVDTSVCIMLMTTVLNFTRRHQFSIDFDSWYFSIRLPTIFSLGLPLPLYPLIFPVKTFSCQPLLTICCEIMKQAVGMCSQLSRLACHNLTTLPLSHSTAPETGWLTTTWRTKWESSSWQWLLGCWELQPLGGHSLIFFWFIRKPITITYHYHH